MEEIIPTLNEEGEEYIDTLEENTILAGVQTINGKAGDLDLKTINGQDILTPGNLALATSAQMTAETEARVAADSAEVTARTNAVNAEKTARENADTALQNAINTKQDKLIAGANIQIASDGKTISATDTTYTAGNGMKLTGTTFAVDTDAIQTKLSTTQMDAVNSGATTAKIAQITTNQGDITTINGKIPTQASTTNQLADKNFVNSSVQTATANFRGSWADWASVPTSASAYPPDYAGSTTPTVNDYLVIQDASDYTEETLDGTWRFKYTGDWDTDGKTGWLPEYQVNETPMTAAQLAAINSGITDTLVAQISTNAGNITSLQNGKQDNLNSAQLDAVNSGIDSTKVAQITTNTGNITALQTGKQDKLTAGSNIQIDQDTDTISATDTTYTAGTGLNLTGTVFSADTTVLATQADLATKADASDVYTKAEINAGTDNLGVPSGFFTDTTTTVSGEGTNITLNGTGEQPLADYRIKGDASQQTYTGKNKFGAQQASTTLLDVTSTIADGIVTLDGTTNASGNIVTDLQTVNFTAKANTTYTITGRFVSGSLDIGGHGASLYLRESGGTTISGAYVQIGSIVSDGSQSHSFTVTTDTPCYLRLYVNSAGVIFDDLVLSIQVEEGNAPTAFEPYVGGIPSPNPDYPQDINVVTGTQTVTLGDGVNSRTQTVRLGSLELVKIGNYQDYIWTDGEKWYKHKVIKKTIFDGSENWTKSSNVFYLSRSFDDLIASNIDGVAKSDYFTYWPNVSGGMTTNMPNGQFGFAQNKAATAYRYNSLSTAEDWKAWLAQNPVTVYYVLATPTDETITDADLIADLDALYNTKTYGGQTNIGVASVSPNLPGILTVDAFKNNLAGTLAGYNEQIARLEARVADLEA